MDNGYYAGSRFYWLERPNELRGLTSHIQSNEHQVRLSLHFDSATHQRPSKRHLHPNIHYTLNNCFIWDDHRQLDTNQLLQFYQDNRATRRILLNTTECYAHHLLSTTHGSRQQVLLTTLHQQQHVHTPVSDQGLQSRPRIRTGSH